MLQPRHARVTRWPGAFPQYRPHHAELVAAIEAALPSGLVVAGASYHGIGVPACIKSARNAAQATSNSAPSVAE
jgi:oxygen-dependent protoporphyrinogen oxidase